jgi:hypothetical protein
MDIPDEKEAARRLFHGERYGAAPQSQSNPDPKTGTTSRLPFTPGHRRITKSAADVQ